MSFEQMGFNPEEQFNDEKAKEANFKIDQNIKEDIENNLNKGFLERAMAVAEKGQINKEVLQEIVKNIVLRDFKDRNHKDMLYVLDYYGIGDNFLKNESFVKLGKDRVNLKLTKGDVIGADEVLKDLNIDKQYLKTEEAKEAAKKGIKSKLSLDHIDEAINIKKTFDIDDAFMKEVAKEEIRMRFKENLIVGATSLQKKFDISDEFIREMTKEEVLSRLSSGNSLNGIAHFINEMKMDASFLADKKIKEAIRDRIRNMMGGHGQEKIPDIFKEI